MSRKRRAVVDDQKQAQMSDKKNSKTRKAVIHYEPGPLSRFIGPRYWLIWTGLAVVRLLMFLPFSWQLWLGRRLGELLFFLLPGRRFYASRNLELCFPEMAAQERSKILKDNFRNLGMSVFETAMSWWASGREMQGLYEVEGLEEVDEALAAGHGVILLTAHFTPLELCGRMLNHAGLSYDAMYRRHNNPLIEEVMRRGREKCAATVIAKKDLRGLLKSLRANRPVWYAPDQKNRASMSSVVPFFGVPAVSSVATSSIAKSSKALVLPFVGLRDGNRARYRLKIFPPFSDFPSDDPVADTLRINQTIEGWIRDCPDQYYWVHRRFRHRPESYGDAYARN